MEVPELNTTPNTDVVDSAVQDDTAQTPGVIESSEAAAPTPTPTPTPTPAKVQCDDMQITVATLQELNGKGLTVSQVNEVLCAPTPTEGDPEWAAAAVMAGTDSTFLPQKLIFQVKDGKWVYEPQDKVCGSGSPIPSSIRNFAC